MGNNNQVIFDGDMSISAIAKRLEDIYRRCEKEGISKEKADQLADEEMGKIEIMMNSELNSSVMQNFHLM